MGGNGLLFVSKTNPLTFLLKVFFNGFHIIINVCGYEAGSRSIFAGSYMFGAILRLDSGELQGM